MREADRVGAPSLLVAIGFQKRVLATLNAGLDQLTSREVELLDACLQVYLEDWRPRAGDTP